MQAGTAARIEIRNLGWVGCTIVWANDQRAGLHFSDTIDPAIVRASAPNSVPATRPAGEHEPRGPDAVDFYIVRWMKGNTAVAEACFSSLVDAKGHARDRLGINKVRKGVTAVEVSDVDGVGYFRFE